MENSVKIRKIQSGGQTGADRAAWDAALAQGVPCGGWVPRGRLAEDGTIPAHYPGQVETASADVTERTRLNVREVDATLILYQQHLRGGSRLTQDFARKLGRPCLSLDLDTFETAETAVAEIRAWLSQVGGSPLILNVAGPRASEDAAIYAITREIVEHLLRPA
jgi:hypothetical protein